MRAYRILAPGRRAADPLLAAADTYAGRLERYARLEVVRLREGTPEREAQAMLALLVPGEPVVALDERGTMHTTRGLMGAIQGHASTGARRLNLLIGGADGLGPAARARASQTWALSALTLPHRAALMLLLEQLYRVHTILRGEQYHRD